MKCDARPLPQFYDLLFLPSTYLFLEVPAELIAPSPPSRGDQTVDAHTTRKPGIFFLNSYSKSCAHIHTFLFFNLCYSVCAALFFSSAVYSHLKNNEKCTKKSTVTANQQPHSFRRWVPVPVHIHQVTHQPSWSSIRGCNMCTLWNLRFAKGCLHLI